MIMTWGKAAGADEALMRCHRIGLPGMLCLSNAASLTDEALISILEACHSEGYLVGFAASYVTAAKTQHFFDLGCDFAASGHELNIIQDKLDTYVSCYVSFSGLNTTGTVTDNNLILAANDTVSLSETLQSSFLKASYLEIVFTGDITVSMGQHLQSVNFTADSERRLLLSTCDFNTALDFLITANDSTVIKELVFKSGSF